MTAAPELARNATLVESLWFAVPFHIAEVRHRETRWLVGEAKRMATVVASHGDDLQYGGKHCAEAFNAFARSLACAALVADGGVSFAGLHWCAAPRCRDPLADHPETAPELRRLVEDIQVAGGLL